MLTNLTCSKCGDEVLVTASSVVLPFVCGRCEDEIADFTKQTYEDMKPKATYEDQAQDEACQCGVCAPEPAEEFASVENTTLLIEDLEKQLAEAKQRIGYFEKTIDVLDARIRCWKGKAANLAAQIIREVSVPWYTRLWEQVCDRLPMTNGRGPGA